LTLLFRSFVLLFIWLSQWFYAPTTSLPKVPAESDLLVSEEKVADMKARAFFRDGLARRLQPSSSLFAFEIRLETATKLAFCSLLEKRPAVCRVLVKKKLLPGREFQNIANSAYISSLINHEEATA